MELAQSGFISDGSNPGLAGLSDFAPGSRTLRLKKPYMRGADVRFVQRTVGLTGQSIDGVFGPQTNAAVQQYQRNIGFGVVDGSVGPALWKKLKSGTDSVNGPKTGVSVIDDVLTSIDNVLKGSNGDTSWLPTPIQKAMNNQKGKAAHSQRNTVYWLAGGAAAAGLLGVVIAAAGDNK